MAKEAEEPLRAVGFAQLGEGEGLADEVWSAGYLTRAFQARRVDNPAGQFQLGARAVPIELCSFDRDSGCSVGFACAYDLLPRVFYAKLQSSSAEIQPETAMEELSMKGAITTLLDVAEACSARKIHLGLGPELASCADLICSFLYLGFQVVPGRKFPWEGMALMLEFEISWPLQGGGLSSDQTCTATSQCSTSVEDEGDSQSESPEDD